MNHLLHSKAVNQAETFKKKKNTETSTAWSTAINNAAQAVNKVRHCKITGM